MPEGVAAIWMPVHDIEWAKGFYRDNLELPIKYEDEDAPWAVVDANGLSVGLNGLSVGLDGREPQGAAVEGGLEETVSTLQDRGVEVPAGISEHPWAASPPSRTQRATTSSSTSRPRAKNS